MTMKNREFYLICLACGNVKEFERETYGTARLTRQERYDAETDNLEQDDPETEDEEMDGDNGWECIACGSNTDVEECDDEEEIEKNIWKHTDKKGEWSESELDVKDRDEKLGKVVAINTL